MKKLIALLTAAVATLTSAWAATPVAVWEGNFPAGDTADQNFTLTYATGNTLETDADTGLNYIKIGSTTGLGVSFMRSSQFGATTVLVKYSDYSPSAATTLATFRANNSNNNRVGIAHKADGTIQGLHSGANFNDSSAGNKFPAATDGMKTIAFRYSTNGVACYDGETELYRNSGYKWSSDFNGNGTVNGVTLGGAMGSSLSEHGAASGMKIHAVAVFNSEMSGADIAAYKWPSAVTAYTGTVAGGQVTWDKPLPETPAANDYLKFVGAGDIAVPANYASFGQITIGEGVNLTGVAAADIASGKFTGDGAIVITSNCTLTVPVDVKVKTRGDIAVTLTNDGTFEVENGTCSVNAPENEKIAGTIIVRSGATFKNVRVSDAIKWGGTVNIHVYGTLDFDETRWTLGANNNIYLYAGAVVMGSGQGTDGALDFNGGNGTIYVKPNGSTTGVVTCSAPMRNRQGGTINVDQNMVFETTGNVIKYGNGVPTKVGSGVWSVKGGSYESGATVNAGTLKLVGVSPASTITMGNGTLELSQNEAKDAFTFTGTVASAALGNGTIKTAGSTVTLSGTFTNYSGDIDSSAADSKFIIPVDQEVTVGLITSGSKIEIEGMLVHTNKATNAYTNYQGKNLSGLTGNGTFKITGPHYFFTCGTSNLNNYWASTLAIWNERGDSTIADNKGIIFGQPNNANATITIGSLSGAGLIRSDANSGERTIKIVQAKNTEWSGAFNAGDRVKAVIVTGADGATEKTLTLSGTQTHNNDLTIESAGSVKLTGTWIATTTTVEGRLEVFKTATLTSTTTTATAKIETEDSVVYFGSIAAAITEGGVEAVTVLDTTATLPAGYENYTINESGKIVLNVVTIAIPAVTGMTAAVTVNGATVDATSGSITAAVGATVVVTYTPSEINYVGGGSVTITAAEGATVETAGVTAATLRSAGTVYAKANTLNGGFKKDGKDVTLLEGDVIAVKLGEFSGTQWQISLDKHAGYDYVFETKEGGDNRYSVVTDIPANTTVTISEGAKVYFYNSGAGATNKALADGVVIDGDGTLEIENIVTVNGAATISVNTITVTSTGSIKLADGATLTCAKLEEGDEITKVTTDVDGKHVEYKDGAYSLVANKSATELFLEAINGNATEVTLTGDVAIESMITLTKDFAITLNGHTLSFAGDTAKTKSLIQVVNEATLTINGTTDGSKVIGRLNAGKSKNNNGSITLNGGTYEVGEGQTVLHVNGECKASDITIKNATIISANDNGIQLNGAGTHTITGSTITGATAVYVKGGNVTIDGNTTLTATGTHVDITLNDNGSNPTGDAIVFEAAETAYQAIGEISIADTVNLESTNGSAVLSFARANNTRRTGFLPAALKSNITEEVATAADLFDDYVEPSADLPGASEVPADQKDAYNTWAAENGIEATGEYTDAQKANFATAYAMNVTLTAEQKEAGITIEEAAQKAIENEVPLIDMAELVDGDLEAAVAAIQAKYGDKVTVELVEAEELTSTETSKFFKLSITIKK